MLHNVIEEAITCPNGSRIADCGGAVGIVGAWVMYIAKPDWPAGSRADPPGLIVFVYNKWFFDELYDRIFVRPSFVSGAVSGNRATAPVIDGVGPDGIAAATRDLAARASRLQSGFVYHYAFAMLIGLVVLATWFLFGFYR